MRIEATPITVIKYFINFEGEKVDVEFLADILYRTMMAKPVLWSEIEYSLLQKLIDKKILNENGYDLDIGSNFSGFYNELIEECEKMNGIGFDIKILKSNLMRWA